MISRFFRFLAWLHGDKEVECVVCEWHSFWVGFSETVCLRIPPIVPIDRIALKEMSGEWHYYSCGRASGVVFWVVLILVILWMYLNR